MIIEKALSEFYKALEEDKKLRELYERVNEEGLFEKYFREDGGKGYEYFSDNGINGSLNDSLKRSKIEISPTVRKVNKSLREAANHLSLAFFEDNRILFMGDVESYEVKQIVEYLKSKNRQYFYILITPHHSTHWHNSLNEIYWDYSISSNGPKLCSKTSTYFKKRVKFSFSTHTNGGIEYIGRNYITTLENAIVVVSVIKVCATVYSSGYMASNIVPSNPALRRTLHYPQNRYTSLLAACLEVLTYA